MKTLAQGIRRSRGGSRAGAGPGFVVMLAALALAGCADEPPPLPAYDEAVHRAEVEEWRAWRHGELVKPDGWLSLSGLYWLAEGDHRFGADSGNEIVYDRVGVPAVLGTFRVESQRVSFEPQPGVDLRAGEAPVAGAIEVWAAGDDGEGARARIGWGAELQWYVIEREDHLALRVKDAASPRVLDFEGMEYFDLAPEWRFEATFEPYDPPRTIKVPNVFGSLGDVESPGAMVFARDGETYRIDMWRDSDDPANFFTAVGDTTNADETYGAGRFLWVDAPDEWGRTVVDFNRSYNPPCALSPFATCPLPPVQNRLPLAIRAGEKTFAKDVGSVQGPPGSEG